MEDLLASIDALADRIPGQIAELEAQRIRIDADLKRLRGLWRVLDPKGAQNGQHRPVSAPDSDSRKSRRSFASTQVLITVGEAILASGAEEFTAIDIAGRIEKLSEPHVYMAFNQLRDMGFLGYVGQAPPIRKGVQGRGLFRVFNANTLDTLKEQDKNKDTNNA